MAPRTRPTLITDARQGRTLSADQRQRRYLWTMAFRVVAFLSAVAVPLPWNIVLIAAAAVLPGIAVLFGNMRDNRVPPPAPPEEDIAPLPAIGPGDIVPGAVVPEPAPEARR